MFRYNPATLLKLEQLFREGDYVIRYEKGNFKAGFCVLRDKRVVVINKYFDTESRINSLLDILAEVDLDSSKLSEKSVDLLRQIKETHVSA